MAVKWRMILCIFLLGALAVNGCACDAAGGPGTAASPPAGTQGAAVTASPAPTAAPVSSPQSTPKRPTVKVVKGVRQLVRNDMTVDSFPLFAAMEAFTEYFGEAEADETVEFTAEGRSLRYLSYPFGMAVFEEGEQGWRWTGIRLTDPALEGPRGIRVGDSLKDIWKVFPSEAEWTEGDQTIFYRYNQGDHDPRAIPPSGEMYARDGEPFSVTYDFPVDAGGQPCASYDYDFIGNPHVTLQFVLEDGQVSAIVFYAGDYLGPGVPVFPSDAAPLVTADPAGYSRRMGLPPELADMLIDGLPLYAGQQEYFDRYGVPSYIKTFEWAATGERVRYCGYPFGMVTFAERDGSWEWKGIRLLDPAVEGPRGIRVGDALEDVFAAFPHETECTLGDTVVFYRYNRGSGDPITVSPSGIMGLEDGQPVYVSYDFPRDEDWEQTPDYEMNFQYMVQIGLSFSISDGRVTAIGISSGAYAE